MLADLQGLKDWKRWLPRPTVLVGCAVLAVGVLWSFWNAFAYLVVQWCDPDYGHGFFVPVFSLWLLYYRRDMLRPSPGRGDSLHPVGIISFQVVFGLFAASLGFLGGALTSWVLGLTDAAWTGVLLGLLVGGVAGLVVGPFVRVSPETLARLPARGTWWGLALVGVAVVLRWASVYFSIALLDPYSLVPLAVGLTLLVGGWRALLWAGPSLEFLVFMFPLPGQIQDHARYPLQYAATAMSVFLLQTCGFAIPDPAGSNVIQLPGGPLQVAQACSGLRMLMLFCAICYGAAFVMKRPVWQRIVVLFSIAPIAILSNVMRITSTGVIQEVFGLSSETTYTVHEYAGLVMMPLALLLLWGEVTLLGKLFLEPEDEGPLALGHVLGGTAQQAVSRARAGRREPT
jgi:exosortase